MKWIPWKAELRKKAVLSLVTPLTLWINTVGYTPKWASPAAQQVKNLPAVQKTQETWVQSHVGKIPLEKETPSHSSILT